MIKNAFVTINLRDTNDQSPEFQSTILNASVWEDAVPGTLVFISNVIACVFYLLKCFLSLYIFVKLENLLIVYF